MHSNRKLEYGGIYLLADKIYNRASAPGERQYLYLETDVLLLKIHHIDPSIHRTEIDTKTGQCRRITTTPVIHSFPVGQSVVLLATGDQVWEMTPEVVEGFQHAGRFWIRPLEDIALVLIDDMRYYALISCLWPGDDEELAKQLANKSND